MKKTLLTLCLLTTLIPFTAAAEDYPLDSPAALVIDGKVFDPICFLNDWSDAGPEPDIQGVSYYPLEGCRIGEIAVEPNDPTIESDYIGASYAEDFYDDDADEVTTIHGYIAYRYVGDYDGKKAIVKVENGGGSGIFSNLSLYELNEKTMKDGATQKVLQHVESVAGGDRCNGGIEDVEVSSDKLLYSVNVTPYDILFLHGDPEREILQSSAANEVISCSRCCYAYAHFTNDKFTGMTLNKENIEHLTPDADDAMPTVMGCIDKLVKLNLEYDSAYFDAEGTEYFIREIEHTCLGRVEGEGEE